MAATKAAITARIEPPTVISTVVSAPSRRPGRNSRNPAKVATTRPAAKARIAVMVTERNGIRAAPAGSLVSDAPRLEPAARIAEWRLFAGAELFRRLGRKETLAEAEWRHQGDVLGAADELLQLRIEGLIEILVFL